MGRSGYSDDYEYGQLWMESVERAIQGARGQQFMRDLLAALDALPEKRLIAEELQADGDVCALGSVGRLRGVDLKGIAPEAHRLLSQKFNIAPALVKHVEFVNDEDCAPRDETPEQRYQRVYEWAKRQIWEWRVAEQGE